MVNRNEVGPRFIQTKVFATIKSFMSYFVSSRAGLVKEGPVTKMECRDNQRGKRTYNIPFMKSTFSFTSRVYIVIKVHKRDD